MAEHGQVLPDGPANACADQQEQERSSREAERPQRQHLIRQVQMRRHNMLSRDMHGSRTMHGLRHRTRSLSRFATLFRSAKKLRRVDHDSASIVPALRR